MSSSGAPVVAVGDDLEAGEATPLVPKPPAATTDNDEPPPLEEIKEHTFKEQAVAGAAAVTFSSSLAAMLVENHPSVYVSGLIGAAVAPYAAMQQQKLTQVEALRQTNQRMGEEVAQLQQENDRLQSQVQDLESSVTHLQEMQTTLETVRAVEGQSVRELERQLQESEQILDRMHDNLSADILQNIMSVVLACDDGDLHLQDNEIDEMIAKIEGIQGVDLKEDTLREKLVEQGRSMNSVMGVVKNLLSDDVPAQESIFHFMEKK